MSRACVITRVTGGLGNQLFQYAAAFDLANRFGLELFLDTTWYDLGRERDRAFLLHRLNINESANVPVAGWSRLNRLMISERSSLSLPSSIIRTVLNVDVIREDSTRIQSSGIEKCSPNASNYLVGYWQSEKFFESSRDVIRRKLIECEVNQVIPDTLRAIPSEAGTIGLHVRRGDFLLKSPSRALPDEYYHLAVTKLLRQARYSRVLVFSDEPEYCKKNLKFDLPSEYIADFLSPDPLTELFLLASCSAQVISNSTFAWWAAWLGCSDKQVVVRPSVWLDPMNVAPANVYPERWIKL